METGFSDWGRENATFRSPIKRRVNTVAFSVEIEFAIAPVKVSSQQKSKLFNFLLEKIVLISNLTRLKPQSNEYQSGFTSESKSDIK